MEIREIRTFLQAAQAGSFVKAAQGLGYSQAAVTIQIKHLEEELGTVLFDRIGKQTQLTESGRTFEIRAKRILQEIEEARAEVGNLTEIKGELRIGTIESIGAELMPELLTKLHEEHPDVTVEMELDSPPNLLELLNRNQLDIVYLMDKRVMDMNFVKEMEEPEEVVTVMNATHPLASADSLSMDTILKQQIILTERGASYREALERYLLERGREVKPFLTTGSTEFIVRFLKAKQACSFLPKFAIAQELEEGTLKEVQVEEFAEESPLTMYRQLLYRKDKWVNPQMRAFIDIVTRAEQV
ncbi:MAG: LysR family transcriptional regulator [Lachnospiraceae bacterium]|jgi:DNA-binding transcriptional LysR family regulator|nr:LysR family transcriptional regulator [Lachnospiraceae bacterium]